MSLPVYLMNPPKKGSKKKNPKRVAAAKKAAKTRKRNQAKRKVVAKKATTKRRKYKVSKSRGGQVLIKTGRSVVKTPKGSTILFSKKPRIKRIAKKKIQRMTAFQKNNLKSGGVVELSKGKRSVSGKTWSNPPKRKSVMKKRHYKKRSLMNPQFNMKKIASFGGGIAAAVIVHKYGVALIGNFLSKVPFIGQYAEKINTNKWANILSKGALAALVYKVGAKKSLTIRDASKAYAGTALALVIMQAVGVDQKLMVGQAGMGEMEGIEMNGIEMNGIEMNGIESLGEIEGIEMGEVYGDGLSGNEGVY